MAELLIVNDDVTDQGWHGGGAVLVRDEQTGRHYVASTAQMPWQDEPETVIYEVTDPSGNAESVTSDIFVAGGPGMNIEAAIADLSDRLDRDDLLDESSVGDALAADYDAFLRYMGLVEQEVESA